ncbi:hypothetical protein [Listeria seeligeri]|uniref:hypothetical protein n=1 Tax=Listeria seeligeri TaxID=1640 RepID=UPI00194201F3|nr:hypothetical protein [Listeria seeligeri]
MKEPYFNIYKDISHENTLRTVIEKKRPNSISKTAKMYVMSERELVALPHLR